jgi:hypothetical protein
MENTPATRKATKARIGPWYVLQQRNPAAPGMRFETLLTFVRKGRVKPRSVVRGPSTHQLWRYAMHVRGVSREFGLCYSCGGMIDRDASVCPRCNRSQEPPANPDALLEGNGEAATLAAAPVSEFVQKDLSAFAAATAAVRPAADIVVPTLGPAAPPASPEPVTEAPPASPAESAPQSAPVAASTAAPRPAPAPSKPARTAAPGDEAPPTAWHVNDLAAAFHMQDLSAMAPMGAPLRAGGGGGIPGSGDGGRGGGGNFAFDPYGGGRAPDVPAVLVNDLPPFYPRRRTWGRPVVTLLLVGMLGVVIWLCFDDIARRRTAGWFQDAYHALRRTGGESTIARQREDPKPSAEARSGGGGKPGRPKTQPQQTQKTTPPSDVNATPAAAGAPASRPMAAAGAATTTTHQPAPNAIASNAGPQEFPYTAPDHETIVPAPAPPPAAPAQPSLEVQQQEAMTLFNKAIDAQAARDFRAVVRLLEQIKTTYPKEAWPGGLDVRLQIARGQIK